MYFTNTIDKMYFLERKNFVFNILFLSEMILKRNLLPLNCCYYLILFNVIFCYGKYFSIYYN